MSIRANVAEGFGFQTLQQCSTLFQPWRGQTGCGAEGQGGGTRTSGGRGPTKPAFENPKLGFVFSKPGFVAPKPGFGAGGTETGQRIAGREGRRLQKSAVSSVVWAKMRGFVQAGRRLGCINPRFFPFPWWFCSKILGFIGDFCPFGQSFPQMAFSDERMNSCARFENQTIQPVLH